jgi:hypothetical protein
MVLLFSACVHAPPVALLEKVAFGEITGDPVAAGAIKDELRDAFGITDAPDALWHLNAKVIAHWSYEEPELQGQVSGVPFVQQMVRRTDRLRVQLTLMRPDGTVEFESEYDAIEKGAAQPLGCFTDSFNLLLANAQRIVERFRAREPG